MKSLRGRKASTVPTTVIKKEPYLAFNQTQTSYVMNNNAADTMDSSSNYLIRKQQSYYYGVTYQQDQQLDAHIGNNNTTTSINNNNNNNNDMCAYDTNLTQNFFDPNDIFQLKPLESAATAAASVVVSSKSPQTVLDMESGTIQPTTHTNNNNFIATVDGLNAATYKYDSCDDAASLSSSSIFDEGYYSVGQSWETQSPQDYFEYEQTPTTTPTSTDLTFNYYNPVNYEPEYISYCQEYQTAQQMPETYYEFL